MKFSTVLSLFISGAAIASALPSSTETVEADCIKPYLCCGELKTPLDSTVDPILKQLGINAASIVGSIGLACHAWDDSCKTAPKCCTEANLLGGTIALGCSDLVSEQ
ncbi:hypothetical protein BDV27DRAFT_167422 [Aspergillus caelatus]|uniref:Hydrophobin n=1 Tax=Aspergillus caelatus TaxID=61420 RepID=A0A5N6ZTA7_9EURO|nr:uncharacterized protein BDV27DRAFT_167422 [Aspergillus caelatus]KAE8360834.1 hypothetical protein BDV27DRAFT_167422 [Aspergillus caelatus]